MQPDPAGDTSTNNVEVPQSAATCARPGCTAPVPPHVSRCRDHTMLKPEEYDARYGPPARLEVAS